MKKILLILMVLFLTTGCNDASNAPKKLADDLMYKYQTLHSDVVVQLDKVINNETDFTSGQKVEYKKIMERQFKDLSYVIKEDIMDGNTAIITMEIKVYAYGTTLKKTSEYLVSNPEEFKDATGKYDPTKYNDYKIEQLKNTKDKTIYTINIDLTKSDDGKWSIDSLSDVTLKKIYGLYIE